MTTVSQHSPSTTTKFQALAAFEPYLNELLNEARSHSGNCANAAWYGKGGLKAKMVHTVGFLRILGPAELQTMDAYDVAYKTLYAALPDCKGCGCLTLEEALGI
jgi:hypothetical protein